MKRSGKVSSNARHCGSRAPPADDAWPVNGQIPLTCGPLPDIA